MNPSDKVTSPPPAAGLAGRVPAGEYVATARRLAEISADLQRLSVIAERIRGVPWEAIGHVHGGLSRAAVHNRYAHAVKSWGEEHPGSPEEQFTVVEVQLQAAYAEIDLLLERQRDLSRLSHATASVAEKPETELSGLAAFARRARVTHELHDWNVAVRLAREARPHDRTPSEDPLDHANIRSLLHEYGLRSAPRQLRFFDDKPPTLEERVAALEGQVERLLAEREGDHITR
ncbi:hypothetical protein OG592_44635 (plasmid) [Streptomyces avidinii]|uniref:hypothetical protein n=1 Tax=Streptomyces avidinii TaxID=1895 RepID=UPI00386E9206|nr:hypothetical protein OG592_44635 [Streptomyces avidinii]